MPAMLRNTRPIRSLKIAITYSSCYEPAPTSATGKRIVLRQGQVRCTGVVLGHTHIAVQTLKGFTAWPHKGRPPGRDRDSIPIASFPTPEPAPFPTTQSSVTESNYPACGNQSSIVTESNMQLIPSQKK